MPTGKLGQFGQSGRPGRPARSAQTGFTYLFVMMLIVLIGMGLAAAGTLWSTDVKRAREVELLFIGNQYRQAIRSYYEQEPNQPRLPQSMDDLLEDPRAPSVVRHLRRAYRDPFTGEAFELIRSPDNQGITGVHSQSSAHPFKVSGFTAENEAFADAGTYADWRFVFTPPTPTPPNVATPGQTQPATQLPSLRPNPPQQQLTPVQ